METRTDSARCVHAWDLPYRHSTHLFPTHLRVDALLAGLLLAYAFHYHRSSLQGFVCQHRQLLLIGGALSFSPAFLFPLETTWLVSTVGLTLFKQEAYTQWNLVATGSVFLLVPAMAVFLFGQRYFVRGVVLSGLK